MKKFMLAAAVVCAAMLAQAASVNWGTPYVLDTNLADVTGSYFLVSLTGNSTEGIAVDNAGTLVDANGAIKSTYTSGVFTSADTLAGVYNDLSVADNGTYVALIVVDAANAFYGISDILTIVGASDDPPLNADDLVFGNYEDEFGLAMQTNTATVTVPEPTVLALLALGVAGLALKRKNA